MWKSKPVSHNIFYIRFDKSLEIIELCVVCDTMLQHGTHVYIHIYIYMIECIYFLCTETLP